MIRAFSREGIVFYVVGIAAALNSPTLEAVATSDVFWIRQMIGAGAVLLILSIACFALGRALCELVPDEEIVRYRNKDSFQQAAIEAEKLRDPTRNSYEVRVEYGLKWDGLVTAGKFWSSRHLATVLAWLFLGLSGSSLALNLGSIAVFAWMKTPERLAQQQDQ